MGVLKITKTTGEVIYDNTENLYQYEHPLCQRLLGLSSFEYKEPVLGIHNNDVFIERDGIITARIPKYIDPKDVLEDIEGYERKYRVNNQEDQTSAD